MIYNKIIFQVYINTMKKTHFKIGDKLEEVVLRDVNENGIVSLEMLSGNIQEYDLSQARQLI